MADIEPTKDKATAYGASLTTSHVVGTAAGTINGDWITPLADIVIVGYCVEYTEVDGTSLADADITFQCKYGDVATVFDICDQAGTPLTFTEATSGIKEFRSFAGITAGMAAVDLRGISAIRATAATTGTTHAAGDVCNVTFIGYEPTWTL